MRVYLMDRAVMEWMLTHISKRLQERAHGLLPQIPYWSWCPDSAGKWEEAEFKARWGARGEKKKIICRDFLLAFPNPYGSSLLLPFRVPRRSCLEGEINPNPANTRPWLLHVVYGSAGTAVLAILYKHLRPFLKHQSYLFFQSSFLLISHSFHGYDLRKWGQISIMLKNKKRWDLGQDPRMSATWMNPSHHPHDSTSVQCALEVSEQRTDLVKPIFHSYMAFPLNPSGTSPLQAVTQWPWPWSHLTCQVCGNRSHHHCLGV